MIMSRFVVLCNVSFVLHMLGFFYEESIGLDTITKKVVKLNGKKLY